MPSTKSAIQKMLPLAVLTGVGMLATDLYLPAVPSLPQSLGGSTEQAQYTLSGFLAALAVGQVLWGWTCDRFGERATLIMGISLLILGGLACAAAPSVEFLILARVFHGLGAGSAAVAVPSLIRKRFNETDSIKAIGAIASIEAVVPALGPILGAGLLLITDWRMSFVLLSVATLILIPFVSKIIGETGPPNSQTNESSSFLPLFKNWEFMRFAMSYSMMFGALIMLVMVAPDVVVKWLNHDVFYFSILQTFGVAAFILLVRKAGQWAEVHGIRYVIFRGMGLQVISMLGLMAIALLDVRSFVLLTFFWCLNSAGVALRGPSTMARSLSFAGPMAGKATGILMFFAFGFSSVGTTLVSPYLHMGFMPVAVALTIMSILSILLSIGVKNEIPDELKG